ncbi:crotonase/enoyl-CoA hydratase family protein [Sphingomonas koreensis]|jgi:enoyl-CoA hydratase/carnithine racemase|uniref:Enoyl-CoA hydratase n=1 Tax=Sphingomonas koreensis TaxID=93064 RepID=A0A1L6J6M3_9SPHN|nr:crotonase/enoyl-CoA hydratase family protein [Sphingomonas koreensis]APR51621.1 enoyl-CoA hydratase [Sphingomonas koreensis]MDC7811778.1 crotonase/enoyl-CoA hydratase family protein [Sphingomonas koreensis]RSU19103.1 crotonase/enoyl-CoA hydratase family protein [Sphingomonas koreensis]RSU21235.1 crotonase/enoyl-CoA hydratase family protein [Sphingomonas koreensis]RSU32201.1 crotonase/enoyl-CoA hydratase family protein [Sphingomonas koreensis]
MSERRVSIEFSDGIADVRLTRPDKMNALDPAMFAGIADAIETLNGMAGLRAVVLSGEGRAFCAGLDMASMAGGGTDLDLGTRSHGEANLFQQVAWGWRTLPVPVIAAAHGIAFGGGFQILSGADIRILAPGTRCSIMEMKWGIVPDMAGFALWRTTVRDDVLRELTYTAREFTAEEALAFGFATRVTEGAYGEAMTLAREIAGRNPHAVRAAKRLANLAAEAGAPAILAAESSEQARLLRSPNQIEAVMANMQKRPPHFTD